MSCYDPSFLARVITGALLECDWITCTSLVENGARPAVFTVTSETGHRFTVTVEE